ncbi:MAG: discoidin domain-containing protein [Candidatus Symbiothrix sp.]|jgi:hypothetical protein|nr:discoidin domain-containing protein [Candidatus Symbiothrix sp.]
MKQNQLMFGVFLASLALLWTACKEDYYTINDTFYDGMIIAVKNPLVGDTLQVERYNNSDQILIEAVNRPDVVFDPEAFIYTVEHDSILSITENGTIQPANRGVTRVNIEFRSNRKLQTSVIVEVNKVYHPVQSLQVSSAVARLLVEQNYTLHLKPYIIVYPAYADNTDLIFELDAASTAFASISAEGVITGIMPGEITIHIVSEDNPDAKVNVTLNVVTEIEITDVKLHTKLDKVTLGLDEKIDLNEVTWVTPDNVNAVNRKLNFVLTEGADVVQLDNNGLLTAIGAGTAKLTVSSKANLTTGDIITKEFTIYVDGNKKDLTRAFWTVTTSADYSYAADGTTGKPEDMFDENGTTFLSLVKPGKVFNGATSPAGSINSFIVDMKSPCKFNTIRWNHRSNNSYTYLRVWGIELEGSDDGENWTSIQQSIAIPNTLGATDGNDAKRYDIPLDANYEYRYLKVSLTKWSDNSGGSTSGSTMQIGEFGLSQQAI